MAKPNAKQDVHDKLDYRKLTQVVRHKAAAQEDAELWFTIIMTIAPALACVPYFLRIMIRRA